MISEVVPIVVNTNLKTISNGCNHCCVMSFGISATYSWISARVLRLKGVKLRFKVTIHITNIIRSEFGERPILVQIETFSSKKVS